MSGIFEPSDSQLPMESMVLSMFPMEWLWYMSRSSRYLRLEFALTVPKGDIGIARIGTLQSDEQAVKSYKRGGQG